MKKSKWIILCITISMLVILTSCGKKAEIKDAVEEGTTKAEVSDELNLEGLGSNVSAGVNLPSINKEDDVENALANLDTDYNQVKWGTHYSPYGDDFPGFVVSITPYIKNEEYYLLIAMTNLYDISLDFSGTAQAKNKDGDIIGETFIYQTAIGSANTVVSMISCGDQEPDGRIHWEDCQIAEAKYNKYVAWEANYAASGNAKDGIKVDYEFYSANGETMDGAEVDILLLSEEGFVLDVLQDYFTDTIAPGEKYSGSITSYANEKFLEKVKNIAIFSNPNVNK